MSVATKAVGAAATTALTGGLGGPVLSIGKHLGLQVAKSVLKGSVGKSLLFASLSDRVAAARMSRTLLGDDEELSDEEVLIRFLEEVAEGIASADLSEDEWMHVAEKASEDEE